MTAAANKLWETVVSKEHGFLRGKERTTRARTPGGWLVRCEHFGGEGKSASAICYLPDPGGAWDLDPEARWEIIHIGRGPNDDHQNRRLKVFGGWLVQDGHYVKWKHLSLGLVFVPDPAHEWVLPGKEEDHAG